jgi:hypothetical protein
MDSLARIIYLFPNGYVDLSASFKSGLCGGRAAYDVGVLWLRRMNP